MTPLTRAEQAVLGAVLLEPAQLTSLERWLRPAHFYHPEHAALYQALLDARAQGHPGAVAKAGEVPVEWVTDAVTAARRTARGVTTAHVFRLPPACPRPAHAPVYGRMVLEGAIHRKVTEHATRLHQAARADATRTSSGETRHYTAVLEGTLRDLAKAWGSEPKPIPPPAELADVPLKPLPTSAEQLADEEWLLSCLAADPSGSHGVHDWLAPGDFTDPGHQQIYRCLTALHHRGEPIDEITVLWEAQRRTYLTDGADGGLDADRVSRICGTIGIAESAAYYGERAVQAAMVRVADAAAQQIQHYAGQALPPSKLISHALHALGPVHEARRRWQTATSELPDHSAAGPARQLTAAARARSPYRPLPSRASPEPDPPPSTASARPQPSRSPAP